MQIRKAVITAAGRGLRVFPASDTVQKGMLPLIDHDGVCKPVLQIIAEDALFSGIEEICVVCAPGDPDGYLKSFESLRRNFMDAYAGVDWAKEQATRIERLVKRLRFAPQEKASGYGHAVYCARDFVDKEPFLLLLGDHLYLSSDPKGKRCVQQLVDVASSLECSVSAVRATREHLIGRYGTVSGKRLPNATGLYQIDKIIEKPSLSIAELKLQTPGLRVGHYLCFFGMHVLSHRLFEILEAHLAARPGGELQLTPALQELADTEKFLALEVQGTRYDLGIKFGLLQAQVAFGLAGHDREAMLSTLVELLAEANERPSLRGSE